MSAETVTFIELLNRVRIHVRTLVRNGQATERGLALRAGISQPYLHRVLKGTRQMTPDLADRLLRELEITVAELLTQSAAPSAGVRMGPGSEEGGGHPRKTASR